MTPHRAAPAASARPRRPVLRIVFAAALVAAFCCFMALGIWQTQRIGWKDALVARVDARLHAEPVDPPAPARWSSITAEDDEYRRVRLRGEWLDVAPARTQAVTELGAGWWLLSPLQTGSGEIVLVNRGFVPGGAEPVARPSGPAEVVGLLRLPEVGGGFLRNNDPAADRWHSRDVGAIAASRGLPAGRVAPYFIDAAHDPAQAGWPRGGLTVVKFRDHHLQYALTWFGMALLTLVAGACLFVLERRFRHHRGLSSEEASNDQPRVER
ncbi:SURF1 family protein [Luteimonas yindakuii]|uniref:SURF1-like protein n=1 Tax=Luteimonas yindakuii TaxID=2565782 RepID=A0A4Z1RLJ8_9GAMM|nr:SURF1 family protein [Luteimonas yindakuii]TKS54491.1 SURF1 family protein [Luteimonas yindakuii]